MDIESRDIAIFLSSTFDDMGEERQAIKQVINGLKRKAEASGISIKLVDLRLGIEASNNENEIYSEKVIRLCLESVENCRPYFIGLLGKRYGWIPKKEEITFNKHLFSDAHYNLIQQGLNEEKSVTEMEMMLGVLKAQEKNAFVYFLDDAVPEKSYEAYRAEQLSHNKERKIPFEEEAIYDKYHNSFQESPLKKEKLKDLKKRLIEAADVKTDTYKTDKQLSQLVKKDLENFIETNFPDKLDDAEREALRFKGFLKKKTATYIPRKEVETAIKIYIDDDNPKPLLITGKSGMGKSTVIAKIQSEIMDQFKHIYAYYVGGTSIQNTSVDIMRDIMKSLKVDASDIFSEEEIPTETEKIPLAFAEWLHKIEEKTVIIIDGINQLQDRDQYDWLPYSIPKNVKFIMSSANEDAIVIESIKNRYEGNLNLIDIKGITEVEQETLIIQEYGVKHGKHEVSPIIMETLVSNAVLNSNPLYLETMINEIVHYGAYDGLEKFIQSYQKDSNGDGSYDLSDVYISALKRRMEEFKDQPIKEIYALLTVTATGLSEDEIQDMLNQGYGIKVSNLDLGLVLGSLGEYLLSYSGLFKWKHTYLNQAIDTILSKEEFDQARHAVIQIMEENIAERKDDRKFSELLQQLISMENINHIIEVLKKVPVFKQYNTHTYYQKGMVLLSNLKQSDKVLIPLFEFYEEMKEMQGIFELGELLEIHGDLLNALKLREIEHEFYVNSDGIRSREGLRTLNNLGLIHQSLGNYQEALGYFESCYELCKEVLGERNPLTLASLNNLGNIHASLGTYREALGYFEFSYDLHKEVLGNRDPATLISLSSLGNIHQSLGNFQQSLGYCESSYELRKEVLGERNPATLRSLNNLGCINKSLGNYQKTLECFETCYELSKEVLGERNPDTLSSLANIGIIHESLGNYQEALGNFESCYELRKEVLGERNPDTLSSLNNLGTIHETLGNYQEALGYLESCYELRREVLGVRTPATLSSLNRLGTIYETLGNYQEALGYFESCYELRKEVLGERIPDTLNSLSQLGGIHETLGNYQEALECFEPCYELRKEVLGERNPDTLRSLNNLGVIHNTIGNYQEALGYLEYCCELRKEVLGEGNPDTLSSLNSLGVIHINLGNYQEALGCLESCYELRKETLGEGNPDTLSSLNILGEIHVTLGNSQEALECFEPCYELRKEVLGERNSATLISLSNLGVMHNSLGNYQESLSYIEKCYELRKEVLGERNPATLRNLDDLGVIHKNLGNHKKSLGCFESCYELRKEVLGERNLATLNSLKSLGDIHATLENYQEALGYFEYCYGLRKDVQGIHHRETINTALILIGLSVKIAENLIKDDLCKEAKLLLNKALEYYYGLNKSVLSLEFKLYDRLSAVASKLKDDNLYYNTTLKTIEVLSNEYTKYDDMIAIRYVRILKCHLERQEYLKGIAFLSEAYETQMEQLGETHKNTLATLNNLAYTYNENGDYEKSEHFHKERMEKGIEAFGENSIEMAVSYHNLASVYKNTKDYSKAMAFVEKALDIRKQYERQDLVDKSIKLLNEIKDLIDK
jgi:preprotein translocase subunit SecA/nephrocystin-3